MNRAYTATQSYPPSILKIACLGEANCVREVKAFVLGKCRICEEVTALIVSNTYVNGTCWLYPRQTVKKYPYINIGYSNRSKVAEEFFDHGKVYERSWDLWAALSYIAYIHLHINSYSFYLYRSTKVDPNQAPFVLVPTKQFEHFLDSINRKLDTNLVVQAGNDSQFKVTFEDDGTPRPRYLGRANNKAMAEGLRTSCPPSHFKLDDEENTDGGE